MHLLNNILRMLQACTIPIKSSKSETILIYIHLSLCVVQNVNNLHWNFSRYIIANIYDLFPKKNLTFWYFKIVRSLNLRSTKSEREQSAAKSYFGSWTPMITLSMAMPFLVQNKIYFSETMSIILMWVIAQYR